jgi:phage terminase small subunit
MQALTGKQQKFVWAYLLTGGEGAEAARQAGYSDSGEAAKVRACTLLQHDKVLEAIHEIAWKSMRGLSLLATMKVEKILRKDDGPDQLKAAFGVLNRVGISEKLQVSHQHHHVHELSHTDAALEALAYLISMRVPEEKLIEQFGHSGLARYRKMLEERDARSAMKVIEHES